MTTAQAPRRVRFGRSSLVTLHRWAGLVLAGFLLLAGVTGALLAWNHELEAAISPELFIALPPAPGAPMLDPLLLRERVQAAYPQAYAGRAPLQAEPGRTMLFRLSLRPGPASSAGAELPNDQVFVNPYTGALQGERKWGDIRQGRKNLMSFIYRLHYTLALGTLGSYTMGVLALLWMADCLVGAFLTFPAAQRKPARLSAVVPGAQTRRGKAWLARWWPSWKVRLAGGSYKLTFDLHRAGGLWAWAMLFVLAWSGVAFNLTEVHDPVMKALFAHQDEGTLQRLQQPVLAPQLDWQAARNRGRALAAQASAAHGFAVLGEDLLVHDPVRGVYRYAVRSSRDILHQGGWTSVVFNADTGVLNSLWMPTGAASGDTIRTWIISLHMALVWGIPFKVFMAVVGLAVAMLSITGLAIWWKKRRGRLTAAQRNIALPAAVSGR
ncbi:PepSY-associated TM helix domain-containing protein [Pseudoduganella sp. HUAS MS19]